MTPVENSRCPKSWRRSRGLGPHPYASQVKRRSTNAIHFCVAGGTLHRSSLAEDPPRSPTLAAPSRRTKWWRTDKPCSTQLPPNRPPHNGRERFTRRDDVLALRCNRVRTILTTPGASSGRATHGDAAQRVARPARRTAATLQRRPDRIGRSSPRWPRASRSR